MRRIRLVLARGALGPLRFARALGFACAATLRFATAHFSAIFRLASGASPLRLHHHLLAVRLVSRHFPPLHVALCRIGSRAAPTLSCPSALRRTIRSPIRAVRLRAEYRPSPVATVSTAPDASRHPCALGSPVALHLARSRYSSIRFIVAALPRLRAALCAANVQREPK